MKYSDFIGMTTYDANDVLLGSVTELFLDARDASPAFIKIDTIKRVIPLAGSSIDQTLSAINVPYTKELLDNTSGIGYNDTGGLSDDNQRAIYEELNIRDWGDHWTFGPNDQFLVNTITPDDKQSA